MEGSIKALIPINEKNLPRHEVIGLNVCVVQSSNQTHIGVKGKIIAEMKNIFVISDDSKERWIPKDTAIFCFCLPNKTHVVLNGKLFIGKHSERIKTSRVN